MRFKSIITILLALVAMAGQANTYKTIKSPVAMTCKSTAGLPTSSLTATEKCLMSMPTRATSKVLQNYWI